jgi:signal transduction histidine kinase
MPESTPRRFRLLNVTGYLTVAAVAAAGITNMQPGPGRWAALGILIVFGCFISRYPDLKDGSTSRRAHVYLAVQTALIVALFVLEQANYPATLYFSILFFILSAVATLALPLKTAALWILVFSLLSAADFILGKGLEQGLQMALPFAGGYLFFGAFADALNKAEAAQKESARLLEELRAAHGQLQEYASQVETLAVVEERNRLSREMHDAVGHRLTVASVQLEGAQRLISKEPDRAARMVGTVREQVREALTELRRAVATLREPLEADLSLPQAVRRLVAFFQEATGLTVHLTLPDDLPDLPDTHRLAVYRAVQESLTNIQRHAQANQVWMQLDYGHSNISLSVSDDGVGRPETTAQQGFGLLGLQERATQLGGHLQVEARPGGGTQLIFSVPLPAESEHA